MRSEEIVVSNSNPWNIGIVSCFRFPGSETRMQLVRHRCGAWSLGDSNITLSESHIFRKKQNREDEWTSWGHIFFCMRILRSNSFCLALPRDQDCPWRRRSPNFVLLGFAQAGCKVPCGMATYENHWKSMSFPMKMIYIQLVAFNMCLNWQEAVCEKRQERGLAV